MSDRDEEPTDLPVGDLTVDLESFTVRLPGGETWREHGDLVHGLIREDSAGLLPLVEVAEALGLLSDLVGEGAPEGWFLEIDPPDRLDELELHEGLALESWGQDQLFALVSIGLQVDFDEDFERSALELVSPMLERLDAVGRISRVSELFPGEVVLMVRLKDMRNRVLGDLIELGDHVRALLLAARSNAPDSRIAVDLILGGHALALLGQSETSWLDVKSQPWDLDSAAGKAELAKDVSALANAEGGVILIPARTVLESGREVIRTVRDLPAGRVNLTQIRDVLASRVFPPLPDLVTEIVPTAEDRCRLVVAVGKHERSAWPHIVTGDPASDFASHAIAIWIRDGDRNRPISAAELHGLLRAGREGSDSSG